MVKVKCPKCKEKILGDKEVGKELTCCKCQHKFVVTKNG